MSEHVWLFPVCLVIVTRYDHRSPPLNHKVFYMCWILSLKFDTCYSTRWKQKFKSYKTSSHYVLYITLLIYLLKYRHQQTGKFDTWKLQPKTNFNMNGIMKMLLRHHYNNKTFRSRYITRFYALQIHYSFSVLYL